jgi:hypothetical protein
VRRVSPAGACLAGSRLSIIPALLFCIALAGAGCAIPQATVMPPAPSEPAAHPLPFKGHLLEGDASAVPPAVAMSLAGDSPVTFTYRE